MALLGARKPQTFGQLPQQMTPLQVYGDGSTPAMFQQQAQQPMQQPMQDQQPAKFKPNLLGVIGDAMQVFGGGQATYMQGVREQQLMAEKMRQRALEAQQERETSWQDYVRKSDYERENAAPKDPYRFEAYNGDIYQIGADGKPMRVFADPTPKTTYITADNGDGTKTIVPIVNGVPQMGGGSTRPQVGAVIADPRKKGGPVQQSPGNFPNG